jgi:hypothetical protein
MNKIRMPASESAIEMAGFVWTGYRRDRSKDRPTAGRVKYAKWLRAPRRYIIATLDHPKTPALRETRRRPNPSGRRGPAQRVAQDIEAVMRPPIAGGEVDETQIDLTPRRPRPAIGLERTSRPVKLHVHGYYCLSPAQRWHGGQHDIQQPSRDDVVRQAGHLR